MTRVTRGDMFTTSANATRYFLLLLSAHRNFSPSGNYCKVMETLRFSVSLPPLRSYTREGTLYSHYCSTSLLFAILRYTYRCIIIEIERRLGQASATRKKQAAIKIIFRPDTELIDSAIIGNVLCVRRSLIAAHEGVE